MAIQEHYGKSAHVEVIVKQLTDADMIRIMARENLEEWGSNAALESETLRATLDAYVAGRVDLGKVPEKTRDSYVLDAPHVTPQNANSGARPYTKLMLARFLGWTKKKGKEPNCMFETAFQAVRLIEEGLVKEHHLVGRKREEAKVLLSEASRAHRIRTQEANRIERAAATQLHAPASFDCGSGSGCTFLGNR